MKAFLAVLFALTLAISMRATPLSRVDAARAIQKYSDFAVLDSIPNATDLSFDRAVRAGIWVNTRAGWEPTSLGRQYFTSVSMFKMKLAKPLHRSVVAVTGIAEEPLTGQKTVEFTWRFTDLTLSLWTYTGATTGDHAGSAVFSLYDDGWRIIDLDCGSARSGLNSRPFKEETSTTGFSFLGEFETNEGDAHYLFQLWRDGTGEVIGVVSYPLRQDGSDQGKIKTGSYDPVTRKLSFATTMDGDMTGFDGTFKAGVLKGVVTRKNLATGNVFETYKVTCTRRTWEDNDLRRFLSREQWEVQYAKLIRFRPEEAPQDQP